jgi:CSLREA domain-containing protein
MSNIFSNRGSWLQRTGVALALLAGSILVGNDYQAQAQTTGTTIVVNTTFDAADANPADGVCRAPIKGNQCTLRAAIQTANLLPASQHPVTVEVAAATYTLRVQGAYENDAATGDLDIKVPMIVTAPWTGNGEATISAANIDDRVFDMYAIAGSSSTAKMDVDLRKLIIRDGNTSSSGGGIRTSQYVRLGLSLVHVLDNHAAWSGGGIHASDDVSIQSSNIARNVTSLAEGDGGGGVAGYNNVDVSYSAIMDNHAASDGGGISIISQGNMPVARVSLRYTTVANNEAVDRGGGVFAQSHEASFFNSTLSGNTAAEGGGVQLTARQAFGTTYPVKTTFTHSAVVSNHGTYFLGIAGLDMDLRGLSAMPVAMYKSYFHGNITLDHNANCDGLVSFTGDSAGNISSDATCTFNTSAGKINTQAQIGPLRNFYQNYWAHEPLHGSPLIDGAVGQPCAGYDLLQTQRPQGAACDIGPLEVVPGSIPTPTRTSTPSPTRTPTPSPSRTPTHTPGPKYTATPVTPEPPMPPMPTFAEQ